MKIEITDPTAQFRAAFEAFARTSRRPIKDLARQQMRGVVQGIFGITPPLGGRKGTFSERGMPAFAVGKRQGEAKITGDLARAFQIIPDAKRAQWERIKAETNSTKQARMFEIFARSLGDAGRQRVTPQVLDASADEVLAWYREPRGRTYKIKGRPRRPAWASHVRAIRKHLLDTQGVTPAGWCAAADLFGAKYPRWIAKWKTTNAGSATQTDLENGLQVILRNPIDHPDSGPIERRIQVAMDRQAGRMMRRVADYMDKRNAKL